MSELVTSSPAISQFSLFAPQQQVFVVERTGNAPDDVTTPEAARNGLHSNTISSASRHDDPAPTSSLAVHDGPSRARIEIRSLDLGLTAAEVVGTPDVLQRFDSNGDGRVDLLESDKATLVRQGQSLSTFAGVGNPAGEVDVPLATPDPEPAVTAAVDPAPVAPTTTAPVTDDTAPDEPKKLYVAPPVEVGPAEHKFVDAHAAATGATTATVAVPKKFYGQGAEIVAGAVQAPAVTLHDKATAVRQPQVVVREDGTGEKRLYDKVAQSDTQQHRQQGHAGSNPTLREKARQVAEAINGSKKTVLVQVATYSTTAAAATKQAAIVVESTDLTA